MSYKLNKKLENLIPYDPITGEYSIRLDANESFFNLSDDLRKKICDDISKLSFNRYPDCLSKEPIKAFSKLYDIPAEFISAGNGSDELISIITSCFFEAGDTIVTVSNDFSMYEFYSRLYEINVEIYQKEADLTIDPDKLINFCKNSKASGLIFSNPCNPTSIGLDKDSVTKIIKALDDCLIILDEAYMDFWDQSVLGDISKYQNLIILKTCSKAIGMAAVRFGFAVSCKRITDAIRAAKSPYNNDSVAQTIVADILKEKEYLNNNKNAIIKNTSELYNSLCQLQSRYNCFDEIYKPCTNFVFIRTDSYEQIFDYLLRNSIAIRKFKGYLRITVGNENENKTFMEVMEKCVQQL